MSFAVPTLPMLCILRLISSALGFLVMRSDSGVSTKPGATALNRKDFDEYVIDKN